MNLELAKQLKAAGFAQNYHGTGMWLDDTGRMSPEVFKSSGNLLLEDLYYVPNLSELVEACGESLWTIYRCKTTKPDDIWGVNAGMAYGKTMEEAVANFWLFTKAK